MSIHNFTVDAGSTNVSFDVFIQNSTDGTALTGLVYNSSGLICYYKKGTTGTLTALTLATQTATGTHSDGGFVELSSTNMPGQYRIDISDTIVASGNDRATVVLSGATNMQPCQINIEITDPLTITGGRIEADVTYWNGSAVATPATAGVPSVDSVYWAGSATGTGNTALATPPTNFADLSITATTGRVDVASVAGTAQTANDNGADLALITGADGVTLATSQANYAPAVAGDSMALTAAAVDAIWDEAAAGHLSAGTVGLASALGSAALIDSTITGTPTSTTFDFTGGSTTNGFYNDQLVYILSGTGIGQVRTIVSSTYSGGTTTITVDEAYAVTPAASDRFAVIVTHVHPVSQIRDSILADSTAFNGADIASILTDTGTTIPGILGTPAGADMSADIAAVKSDTAATLVDTGTTLPGLIGSPSVDLATDIAANLTAINALNDITVADILTTQMTESYAADGSAPTLTQALMLIQQYLTEKSVSGTTLTIKKVDGTTTAATLTLDSASAPTSATRAT